MRNKKLVLKMENQQHYILNENSNSFQVFLSGELGDGHFSTRDKIFTTTSINKDLVNFKSKLLRNDGYEVSLTKREQLGWGESSIYTLRVLKNKDVEEFMKIKLEDKIQHLNDLGFALWIYDDGSLHSKKQFYNICTHAFSYDFQNDYLLPLLRDKFGIEGKITIEKKTDGREFYYIRVGRHDGAFNISEILEKYRIESLDYKIWCSETILLWSKLQAQLKSDQLTVTGRGFTNLLNCLIDDNLKEFERLYRKRSKNSKLEIIKTVS